MKKKKKLSLLQKRALTGFAFITPWLIGFLWFYVKSLIQAVRFSLSKMEMLESGGYTLKFTGLDNFKYALFQDPTYNQILATSIRDIVIDVPLIIFFSLFIAMICNGKFKGRTLVRAILFLPIIMNAGAINNAIEMAREAVTGGVAAVSAEAAVASGVNVDYFMNLFMDLGFPVALLDYITAAVGRIFDIVQASGVQIIIFIAALQSVPGALYEVAKIEGATGYEIVDSFVDSDVVEKAYDMAFVNFDWGVSVAMSLLSSVIVIALLVIVCKLISKKVFYYN